MSDAPARVTFLGPAQQHALTVACAPIEQAFDASCYLVGSALCRKDFRDVDVRLILDDAEFEHYFGIELDQHPGKATALWRFLCMMISRDMSAQTGLPIDFQIQARSIANRDKGLRNALFVLDAIPNARRVSAGTAQISCPIF